MNTSDFYLPLHSLLLEVGLEIPAQLENPLIKSISCDSRFIEEGCLFIGLPGEKVDGGTFLNEAILNGAVAAAIGSKAATLNPPPKQDVVLVLPEPVAYWAGLLASAFWKRPSSKMILIGVTGTNGKTTTSYLIEHLSSTIGTSSALFGTLVNRWPGHSVISTHTTAMADVLQAQLASAICSGAKLGVMEVSSHSLTQNRVAGCIFSGAVFTNLSQDHLDYHETMDDYFEAKARLFEASLLEQGPARAVVNIDDVWGRKLAKRLGNRCWTSSLLQEGLSRQISDLAITDIEMKFNGVSAFMQTPCGGGHFFSPLIGKFNLMNLLQAFGVLLQQGLPFDELLNSIADFPGVPGRMERVSLPEVDPDLQLPIVLVDYAHTPDGLQNALVASRPLARRELICVFGCGGDRDRGKRAKMGGIAAQFADRLVVTSDNPRNEDPKRILEDVLEGIPDGKEVSVEIDRAMAIEKAICSSLAGDVVLIAGKGHEDYQILGSKKVYFDDRSYAKKTLRMMFES